MAAVSIRRLDHRFRIKGAKHPGMPAYVGLPYTHSVGIAAGYHGSAYISDPSYNPFNADGDPSSDGYRVPNLTLPSGVDSRRIDGRRGLLGAAGPNTACLRRGPAWRQGFDRFEQEAFLDGPGFRGRADAFDLTKEDPAAAATATLVISGGRVRLLARRLVEAGVRYVTLNLRRLGLSTRALETGMHSGSCPSSMRDGRQPDREDLESRGSLDSTKL